jgi:hypothetical protein
MTLILVFLVGLGIGVAMGFVTTFDFHKKRLEEERDVAYGMGYANGLEDAKKPGTSIEWHQDHLPPSRL